GKALHSPCWSALLLTMIAQVKTKGLSGDKLVRELAIPAKVERYDEEGFKFRPDLGISVQGQSASDCWKEVERLSKKWAIPVSVKFWWKQNPKAQYPGKTGILRSGPASA
ncbi:T4SS efffector SepA family protein, partial [Brucella pinnipedialis]